MKIILWLEEEKPGALMVAYEAELWGSSCI